MTPRTTLIVLLCFIQFSLNVSVICLVATMLSNVGGNECLLTDQTYDDSLCTVTYIASGVAIAMIVIIVVIEMLQIRQGVMVNTLFMVITSSIYIITAFLLTIGASVAASVNVPATSWRTTVYALCWTNFCVSVITQIINTYNVYIDMLPL